MTEELKGIGLNIGHRRVDRVRRENDSQDYFLNLLTALKRYVSHQDPQIHADNGQQLQVNHCAELADKNFPSDAPIQKWAGDINHIWTREGWLYLAIILDLHSRRVVGWAVSNRMKRGLPIRALNMAIAFCVLRSAFCVLRSAFCPKAASIAQAVAANAVVTTTKSFCAKMVSRSPSAAKEIVMNETLLAIGLRTMVECCRRNILQNHQGRTDLPTVMGSTMQGRDGDLRMHQRFLQSGAPPLGIGLEKPGRL